MSSGLAHVKNIPTEISKTINKALNPKTFSSSNELSRYLLKNVCAHAPGRFVVVPKPYGISCVGHAQLNGGIFKNTIHDSEKQEKWKKLIKKKENEMNDITISECIGELRHFFREPKLSFCTGLKRYLSGAIVLPCNHKDESVLIKSIQQMSSQPEPPYMYRALAITIDQPSKFEGEMLGFGTFRNVDKHKEYIFEERRAKKRAKTGKYAVEGRMRFKTHGTANGCSLVEFSVDKFARHLPRLMLTQMGSPILGDTIYWRRLGNVDGTPTLITAGQKGHKIWIPANLGKIVGIENPRELLTSLPIFCHVYNTVFENVGGHERGLMAGCKPPTHFMAMMELLGLMPAYRNFAQSEDDEQLIDNVEARGETHF
ncbi:unnamed protein product [Caenorhabditis bovis]|uniref:Uncharacterized protein n=1 Tax=Caenorhabditis bovis TaxID=2654633 RepID=A0A8S1EA41_9PELO|nr:unnamed protein product [Caenorhabditis bovis]